MSRGVEKEFSSCETSERMRKRIATRQQHWLQSSRSTRCTCPSETADAVHFDADEHRLGALHAAIVGHHLEDVVVVALVVQRLRAPDHTCITPNSWFH